MGHNTPREQFQKDRELWNRCRLCGFEWVDWQHSDCPTCRSKIDRARYQRNKERYNGYQREYYASRPDLKEYKKQWMRDWRERKRKSDPNFREKRKTKQAYNPEVERPRKKREYKETIKSNPDHNKIVYAKFLERLQKDPEKYQAWREKSRENSRNRRLRLGMVPVNPSEESKDRIREYKRQWHRNKRVNNPEWVERERESQRNWYNNIKNTDPEKYQEFLKKRRDRRAERKLMKVENTGN